MMTQSLAHLDAFTQLQNIFGETHSFLVPDATGLDIFRSIELRSPIRTGMRVIDQELPSGIDSGQIIEIRGRESSGKVRLSMLFPIFLFLHHLD